MNCAQKPGNDFPSPTLRINVPAEENKGLLSPTLSSRGGEGGISVQFVAFMPLVVGLGFFFHRCLEPLRNILAKTSRPS